MTKITIHEEYGAVYKIEFRGHANFGPPGQDIVCASVSTVTAALKTISLQDTIDDGFYIGKFLVGKPEHQFMIARIIQVLRDLVHDYPNNVRLYYERNC